MSRSFAAILVAASFAFGSEPRPLAETDVLRLIAADLDRADVKERPALRYLSVVPVANAAHHVKRAFAGKLRATALTLHFSGVLNEQVSHVTRETLDARTDAAVRAWTKQAQRGTSMLVNSLSWAPSLIPVRVVDGSAGQVFCLRLTDYQRWDGRPWDAALWQRVLDEYPYGVVFHSDPNAEKIAAATGCAVPYVRGDWFAHAASRPPLYHDLLDLPETARTLERRLGVDVESNIAAGVAVRSASNSPNRQTPVSQQNRLIERHPIPGDDGRYYWKSYDFADNSPARGKHLFSRPLTFRHDGEEIIFSLPNGLQAYMLANAQGVRLNQAPIEIVRDNWDPSARITNGVSCLRCHGAGLNPVVWDPVAREHRPTIESQVRAHVEANPHAFSAAELEQIRKLYKDDATLREVMARDIARYRKALQTVAPYSGGSSYTYSEPLSSPYEADLGLGRAAAEFGREPREFQQQVRASREAARYIGLLAQGESIEESSPTALALRGAVKRRVFEETFADLVRSWGYAGFTPGQVSPAPKEKRVGAVPTEAPPPSPGWDLSLVAVAVLGLLVLAFMAGFLVRSR
jgi:hypothetical protein